MNRKIQCQVTTLQMRFTYNRKSPNFSSTHVRICVKDATPLPSSVHGFVLAVGDNFCWHVRDEVVGICKIKAKCERRGKPKATNKKFSYNKVATKCRLQAFVKPSLYICCDEFLTFLAGFFS